MHYPPELPLFLKWLIFCSLPGPPATGVLQADELADNRQRIAEHVDRLDAEHGGPSANRRDGLAPVSAHTAGRYS